MSTRSHRPAMSPAPPARHDAALASGVQDYGSNADADFGMSGLGEETGVLANLLGGGSLGGLQAPLDALPPDPAAPLDPKQATLALRMAADALQGGTWHTTQEAPPRFTGAIADLATTRQPLPPLPQECLDLVTRASRGLEDAAAVVDEIDPAWVAAHWRPLVERQLAHWRKKVALEQMRVLSPDAPGVSDPVKEAGALLGAYSDLTDATWKVDAWLDTKTVEEARRLIGVIKWQTELGRAVVDPVTGEARLISPTGKGIDEFLKVGKTALKAVAVAETVSSLGDEGGAAGAADALTLVKRAGDAAVVVAAVLAETSALIARGLAAVAATPEAAASYRATAEACRTTASAIHGAQGVTAALGIVDVATSLVVLLDSEASEDDKLDAGVRMLTGASKVGAAMATIAMENPKALEALGTGAEFEWAMKRAIPRLAAMGPALTALSFAVPISWWAFKASLRTMADTSVAIEQVQLVDRLDDLIGPAERLSGQALVLLLAGEWADEADDPAMVLAYLDAREAYVSDVQATVGALLKQVADCGSPPAQRVFAELEARHPRLHTAGLSAERALDAAADLIQATEWCLENARGLAIAAVGLGPAPRPEPGESILDDEARADEESPTQEEESAAGEAEEAGECTP